ncbi:TRAP transporter small permease [Devosia sp. SL43]|uniref:TRAP transporter small permease n=1 Tax=Devosia sp. SL43 TaxID=2806348 RepID=UPI001F34284F|nr:TRAP transporter small permease [Devosia sp. SL43]UJW84225.1 TRAP transporter small permease [Devosia sp. SL43]
MDNTLAGRFVAGLAKAVAIAGGLVLVAIVVLIVVSVIGRSLSWAGLGPVLGDYELVEAGVGFAVFAFLPWAHLTRGHAVVAIFTDMLGPRFNAWLLVFCDALMLAVAVFLTWRHALGTIDKFDYGETTLLLRMPLGWSFAAGLVGAVTLIIVALYLLVRSLADAVAGRVPAVTSGASH